MESHVSASAFFSVIFVMYSILPQSVIGVNSVNQLEQFSLLKCNGSAVCLESKPNKSSRALSRAECGLECRRQNKQPEYCVGVNYRVDDNVCDVFYSGANITYTSNFTLDYTSNCQYLQVLCAIHLVQTNVILAKSAKLAKSEKVDF
jgi:hypothetical protein